MVDYYEDDEVFRDINSFYKRLMERMFREIQDFEKAVSSRQLQGNWDIKPINKPGVKGYVARGQFQLSGEPIHFPRHAKEEDREPLTDVFEEKELVKIYMELPGVEKSDIQLNLVSGSVEVRAKNFSKTVNLAAKNVDLEKATASYKNGVLEVTIPKIQKAVGDEKRRTMRIE